VGAPVSPAYEKAWGSSNHGGTGAPLSGSYTKIYSNGYAFAALKADGSITTWGGSESGGTNASNVPTDKGYIRIYSTDRAFAALKADAQLNKSWYIHCQWVHLCLQNMSYPTL
jgi:transcription elongation factor